MDAGDRFTSNGWVGKDGRPASIRVIVNPEFVVDRDALALHPADLPAFVTNWKEEQIQKMHGPGWRNGLYSSAYLNGHAA